MWASAGRADSSPWPVSGSTSGFAEVSAVATDPDHRRQGLAELLVRRVAARIIRRGEMPILHTDASNAGAIRLYRSMGSRCAAR